VELNKVFASAVAAVAVLTIASPAASQSVPPLADDMKPMRMSGMGLNVKDIERQKNFYTQVLGFKVIARVPGKDGAAKEYLLGLTGSLTTDTLIVLTATAPAAGSTSFGRIVLVVPSGRKMAERVAAGGGKAPKIADGVNIVYDPEGNMIELYQRPAPKPAG
jgi:catechol 2,3-dioxygenase-like lactoylglutathione lyase family enzyme